MRKLIVSMNTTLDGFLSGPDCELDWHFQTWTEEMAELASMELSKADTIVLGRVTYMAMAQYWPFTAIDPSYPRSGIEFAEMINGYTKIVFSRTLQKADWNNSRLLNGNIKEEMTQLKQQPGKDLILYGSSSLVTSLIRSDLVDEYQVWVHPVILGKGKPFFGGLKDHLPMELFKTRTFRSGVVTLYFKSGIGSSNLPK